MTFLHKLAQRIARLWIPVASLALAAVGCSQGERADFLSPVPNKPNNLQSVRIEPKVAAVQAGAEFRFTAAAISESGLPVPTVFDWSAEAGTISSDGRYVGVVPGPFRVVVRAHDRPEKADTAVVAVWQNETDPTGILVEPASITVEEGDTLTFSALLRLANGAAVGGGRVDWSASGGVINGLGFYIATVEGSYVVSARTSNGFSGTASIRVRRRSAPAARVSIDPRNVELIPGQGIQFTATTIYSDGKAGLGSYVWTATGGGTVSQSGGFLAGDQPGTYKVAATLLGLGLGDTATVTIGVQAPTLTSLRVSPKPATVQAGGTTQFSASGTWSNGSDTPPLVIWSATGGSISTSGVYTAGSVAGTYRVIATQQGGTLADTSTVTVQAPTLVALGINPTAVTVQRGGTQQFGASATWSDGSTSLPVLSWTSTGGSISSSGLFTAGNLAGTYRVIVSAGAKADTAAVTIASASLQSLTLSPKPAQLQAGGTLQFSVSAAWSDGSTTLPPITWSATGGTISASGFYAAGSAAGTYRVIASGGGKADTSTVTVTSATQPDPTLTALTVAPGLVSLPTGGTQQFTVSATWSNGATTLPAITWSATGGTITPGGFYSAGSAAGTYRVIASGGGKADTAVVTLSAPTSQPPAATSGCSNPQPGWIWCDDFEQNRLTSYFEYDNSGGEFIRAAGVGTNGSTGMRARWKVGQVAAGNLKLAFGRTPSSYFRAVDGGSANYREIYWRVYVKHQAGWVGGSGDKLARAMVFADANWSQAMVAHTWGSGNYLVLDPASGTDAAGTLRTSGYNDTPDFRWLGAAQSQTAVFDAAHVGQWYCVETHIKLNSAGQSDGLFELRINGALEAQRTGLNWVGSYNAYGLNAVFLENYWNSGSPATQERYFDDFVVSTQPIGCAGSTSEPPPATVTGFALTPASVTLAAGSTQQFQAQATWSDGQSRPVSVTYSATGGTISVGGLFAAGQIAGTFAVIATCSCGRADTSVVLVTSAPAATLTSLTISPKPVSMSTGSVLQFTASALWSNGGTSLPPLTWSATGGTISSGGLYSAGSTAGTYRVIVSGGGRADTASVTLSAPPPPAQGEPVPGGTILFDTRAGGAQSIQSATSLTSLLSIFQERRLSGGASEFLELNVDGQGTKAHGIAWAPPTGSEQESFLGRYMDAPSDGWYTSWKMYLGRSPTGGGVGSVGQFSLDGTPGRHQKVMLWMRGDLDANGGSPSRIYLVMTPDGANFRIDARNYNSPGLSINPMTMLGQVQRWVVFIQPSTGTIRTWINGVLVLNATGQDLGPTGLSQVQQTATTFPGVAQTQYVWDTVVWR